MIKSDFEQMVCQYEQTAQKIHERISTLKEERKKDPFNNVKRIEERIAILEVEHSHLLKTAGYMRENYTVKSHTESA